jgi:hypothetical protein
MQLCTLAVNRPYIRRRKLAFSTGNLVTDSTRAFVPYKVYDGAAALSKFMRQIFGGRFREC